MRAREGGYFARLLLGRRQRGSQVSPNSCRDSRRRSGAKGQTKGCGGWFGASAINDWGRYWANPSGCRDGYPSVGIFVATPIATLRLIGDGPAESLGGIKQIPSVEDILAAAHRVMATETN